MKRTVKRAAALLCLAALLLMCTPVLAASGTDIDLMEKLRMQPKGSGYAGTGVLAVNGDAMAYPFDSVFAFLKALDGYSVNIAGTGFSRNKKIKVNDGYKDQPIWRTDTLITLSGEESALPEVRMYTDNDTFVFSSPVFGEALPAFGRGNLLRALENTGAVNADAITVIRLISLFEENAAVLDPFVSDLGMRLSAFCEHTEDENGTRLTYRVPAARMLGELAGEVSEMLADKNTAALTKTFRKTDAEDLPATLRALSLSDDFEITRVYDRQAVMVETDLYIPLTGDHGYSGCRIILAPGAVGNRISVTLSGERGENTFSFEKTGLNAFNGCFYGTDAEGDSRAFDWQAEYSIGAVSYDRVKDLAVQELRAKLSVNADGENRTVTAAVILSSGAGNTSPLHLELTAALESDSGARAELSFAGHTFRRTEPGTPDESRMVFLDTGDSATAQETLKTVLELTETLPELSGE